MSNENKRRLLDVVAERAIPDTLDLWPKIQSEVGWTNPHGAGTGHRALSRWLPGPRHLGVGLAIAAALALAIVGLSPLWTNTESVSAQEILDRTAATVNGPIRVTSYHLTLLRDASQTADGKGHQSISAEVWYNGSGQQRTHEQAQDASGAVVVANDVVFDGADTWIARTERGQTTVIHTIGTTWTKPANDPSNQASLTDVLSKYSSGKGCQTAWREGEGEVAGQATYVIGVTSNPGGCEPGRSVANLARAVVNSPSSWQPSSWQMRVWVDEQSFLPLKTETRDLTGQIVDSSEVTAVQYNVAIPSATFTYTPAPGASVSTFQGGTGADVKRQMFQGTPLATPAKKP
jgi:outer membrane lipoprotein-sorting protein